MKTLFLIFYLIDVIWQLIGNWKIFEKAGIKGWRSIIPLVNQWEYGNLLWNSKFGAVMVIDKIFDLLISYTNLRWLGEAGSTVSMIYLTVSLIIKVLRKYKTAKVFGKGVWFTLGMIIFPGLFKMILGCGDAVYQKPIENNGSFTVEPVIREVCSLE